MRILILTKRQYMNRDLIEDWYGRFQELPLALAASGHEVTGLCLIYWHRKEGLFEDIVDGDAVYLSNYERLLSIGSNTHCNIQFWKDLIIVMLIWSNSDSTLKIIYQGILFTHKK